MANYYDLVNYQKEDLSITQKGEFDPILIKIGNEILMNVEQAHRQNHDPLVLVSVRGLSCYAEVDDDAQAYCSHNGNSVKIEFDDNLNLVVIIKIETGNEKIVLKRTKKGWVCS